MSEFVLSIVVNFNSEPALGHSLDSLLEQRLDGPHHIVVWENGSDRQLRGVDLGKSRQESATVWLHYLGDGVNLGYAPGVQAAWQTIQGRPWGSAISAVHLVNPDTIAHGDDVLATLVREATAGARLAGPAQVDATGRFRVSAYPFMRPYNVPLMHLSQGWVQRYGRLRGDPGTSRDVATLDGSYLVAPRSVWDRFGGLDGDYFLYSDDHDLGLRAKEKGISRRLVTDVTVTHLGGSSRGRRARLCEVEHIRASLRLVGRHYGPRAERRARRATVAVLRWRRRLDLAWVAKTVPLSLPHRPGVGIEQRYVDWLQGTGHESALRLAREIELEAAT